MKLENQHGTQSHGGLEDDFPFQPGDFQVQNVSFREVFFFRPFRLRCVRDDTVSQYRNDTRSVTKKRRRDADDGFETTSATTLRRQSEHELDGVNGVTQQQKHLKSDRFTP